VSRSRSSTSFTHPLKAFPMQMRLKQFVLASVVVFVSLPLSGCGGSDKPEMVADPNAYAPYQASPEEIKAQQAQSSKPTQR